MKRGKVFIVGAGPGNPDLLTVGGLRAIQNADVVLYDRLVSPEVMALVPEACEKIYVGKSKGDQDKVQNEIFELLQRLPQGGKKVVRLKGGDPMVFGRGIEEWQTALEAGFEVEYIPGISSALAVPSLAGISLTYRDIARGFAIVTGHRREGAQSEWHRYAQVDTLVILMGVAERVEIARELIELGRDPNEPVAFIENGSTPRERLVRGTLEGVATGQIDTKPPAIWVIGAVTARTI